MSRAAREKAESRGGRAGPGARLLSRLFRHIRPPSGGGVDPEELEDLASKWHLKATQQGSVPYGSIERAWTYDSCAADLEELIEEHRKE